MNVRDDEAKKAGHKASHLKDHWLLADVQVTRSTFSTIATATSAPVAQTFTGVSFLPTFDIAYQFKGINLLAGASGGVKRVNNVDQLTKVSVNTVVGQTGTTTITQSRDAYLGTYAVALNVPIYSDFVIIPKHLEWLSIDAFERANVLKTDGYAEGGIGIFIAQPKAGGDFSKVLGGVSIGWKDGDRSVAIVGGWTF